MSDFVAIPIPYQHKRNGPTALDDTVVGKLDPVLDRPSYEGHATVQALVFNCLAARDNEGVDRVDFRPEVVIAVGLPGALDTAGLEDGRFFREEQRGRIEIRSLRRAEIRSSGLGGSFRRLGRGFRIESTAVWSLSSSTPIALPSIARSNGGI